MSESGVMPLASEVANEKAMAAAAERKTVATQTPTTEPAVATMLVVIDEAIKKLASLGLTEAEAVAVIERRIRG